MFASVIVIGMTCRTGSGVIELERNVRVILLVAGDTRDSCVVIARVITIGLMIVINRSPTIDGMAGVTVGYSNKMVPQALRLIASRCCTIVTRHAVARNTLVIPGATHKRCGGMAVTAVQTGLEVWRYRGIFTDCSRAVVAGIATGSRSYRAVVESRSDKGTSIMADTAILVCRDVTIRLARGERAIVAGRAVTGDTDVIKDRRYKARGLVTHAAILVSGYVIIVLTGCGRTIVTGRTVVRNTGVIIRSTRKRRGVMAIGTVSRLTARIEDGDMTD